MCHMLTKFLGPPLLTVDIGYKVHDEVSVWFVAQQLDRQGEKREACMEKEQMRSWKKKIPL